ncbi:RES family NAD+ phosphorylase [Halomonas tibetensis]|uniref:RES family NAD+ phosphorylase n=1 Tax=Halomonas tibetensis TaxID=2259590 RepID=A0ABV7BBN9_9GAMM
MIAVQLPTTTVYRVHHPRWAHTPSSGAGAASNGGRLNRPGISALYLSLEEATALSEYRQVSRLLPPGTIVSYEVSLASVVDATDGNRNTEEWDDIWQALHCDWRNLWFQQRVEPPSWLLGDLAMEAGAAGILFSSSAEPGGTNLVLFTEALGPDDALRVYDPDGRLPKDGFSWA